MGQELIIPDTFKGAVPAKAFAVLDAQADNLANGIGQSYAVLGYKGKVWSLRYRGERHNFVRPDDGTPATFLDVIILGQAPTKSKSFYKKYEPGQSDGERPLCSSIDGITPDMDVVQKQCDTCALCPRNVWKTDPTTGRKGRECTDYKRLAVLVLPTQTKVILGGQALMEPVFLRVPPASLNSLAILGETMAAQGFHYSSYVTRISFDPNKAHPEMIFRPLQGLTDREAPLILELRNDPTVNRIIGQDAPSSPLPQAQVLPPSSTATGLVEGAPPSPSPGVLSANSNAAPPVITIGAVQAQPTPAIPPQANQGSSATTATTEPQSGGVLDADLLQAAPVTQPAPSQTTADTGPADESDADLDARIAGLLQPAKS